MWLFFCRPRLPPTSTLFPYTTLFRSALWRLSPWARAGLGAGGHDCRCGPQCREVGGHVPRSEEHTSELQSHHDLVCRLLLEKKQTHVSPETPCFKRSPMPSRLSRILA